MGEVCENKTFSWGSAEMTKSGASALSLERDSHNQKVTTSVPTLASLPCFSDSLDWTGDCHDEIYKYSWDAETPFSPFSVVKTQQVP